jgi:acyl-CoA thioester hydrolase
LSYRDVEKRGLLLPVVEAKANYHAPARFDDEILAKTRLTSTGNTSVRLVNEVFRLPEKALLCTGYTVHVLVDREGRPTKIPEDFVKKFRAG